MQRILLAGGSWTIQTTHVKGIDSFTQWGIRNRRDTVKVGLLRLHQTLLRTEHLRNF
jgi:uncharacterized membrane protein